MCFATGDLPQAVDKVSKKGSLWAQDSLSSSHLHPAVVVVDHRSHLCLLEHDLRHPHCREQGRGQNRDTNATHTMCCGHVSTGYKPCTAPSSQDTPHLPRMLPHRSCPRPKVSSPTPQCLTRGINGSRGHFRQLIPWMAPKATPDDASSAPHLHIPVCQHLALLLPGRGR